MSEPTPPGKPSDKPEPSTVPNHTAPPPYQGPTPPPAPPIVAPQPQEMIVTLRQDPNESKRHPLTILFVVIGFIVGLLLGSIFTAAGSVLAHHDGGDNSNRYKHSQPFRENNDPGFNQNGNSGNGFNPRGNTVNPDGPQQRNDSGRTDSGKNSENDGSSQGTDSSSKDSANG